MSQVAGPSSVSAMEVDANPAKRRKVIDADGNIVNSGGLPKPTLNAARNRNMRALILHLHEFYYRLTDFNAEQLRNIDETMKVSGLLWTLFTLKKRECNDSGEIRTKVRDTTVVVINGKKFGVHGQLDNFTAICKLYGLEFVRNDQTSLDLRGIYQSNFFLIYQFRYRCAEGLYQNNVYKISDTGDGADTFRLVSAWGVQSRHLGLTYGANYPPSMQSGMLQQMGPATLLIGLAETTQARFQGKWIDAVTTQLKMVPGIEEFAKQIVGTRFTHANLITEILDVAAFGIAKQVHKASFPHCMLRTLIEGEGEFMTWRASIKIPSSGAVVAVGSDGLNTPTIGDAIPATLDQSLYFSMNWSGRGMWAVMRHVSTIPFTMLGRDKAYKEIYSQWLSISILGLWPEDMAVIEKIFGTVPIKRSKYGEAFTERRAKGQLIAVNTMNPQYVCKLASAAQTKLGAADQMVGIRIPVVSGKAVSVWKDDDERRVFLAPREGIQLTRHDSLGIAKAKLSHLRTKILTELDIAKKISYGTTSWFRFGMTAEGENTFTEDNTPLVLSGQFIGIN